ncbi:MAG: cytochrome C oxidase subunit II [Gammaproteobacteria bacterium]|jgi:cytochrome c oxidase subunit 2|nr:cytochrome C oxidase subunit II [Gammaproteobacteria bacterium]MBT3725314.1 cytochrome C oxidase subunit II [Gammaproteobacteria bacterium]MBT4075022.1 cytochrome C oxidase subunit II [Gammaproteobacteria bacterium]MBT4195360.1 cytochrome C oxidase subunit II [Gammaproteobacteria bacterium]MBT4449663.1 cytochrome C oxidase subunit II [Gammaproteobacteria bacterium]
MSSFLPPAEKIWWKVPVGKQEIVWIAIALTWCLIMFLMMPIWHVYGKQNLSTEAYQTTPAKFGAKVEEMVEKYKVGEEAGIPIVRPPAGSDVYLLGRLWQWYPILELEKDKDYRIHLSSMDWQHGFSLQPLNINLQIVPGYEMVTTMTPDTSGEFGVICNEYCGIGHHTMVGKIYVKEK